MLDALSVSLHPAAVTGFFIYMLGAAVLLALFQFVYTRMTPHQEFALIRENNVAASIALSGTIIGFAIPAGQVIAYSSGLLDFVVWALIAGVVQLLGFGVTTQVIKNVPARIRRGDAATGIYVAAVAISLGLLNAACMTPPNI